MGDERSRRNIHQEPVMKAERNWHLTLQSIKVVDQESQLNQLRKTLKFKAKPLVETVDQQVSWLEFQTMPLNLNKDTVM